MIIFAKILLILTIVFIVILFAYSFTAKDMKDFKVRFGSVFVYVPYLVFLLMYVLGVRQ